MTKKYDTVIWDWNGTLLDDVSLALRVANGMLRDHGYRRLDTERYQEIFDFPVRGYYERAGFDLSKHDFAALSTRFCLEFEERLHEASLFPQVREAVSALGNARQFILSNTEQSTLDRMLAAFDIAGAFESAYGAIDNLAIGKADIGKQLVDGHGVDPQRAVLIGDTIHDAEVAETLQIDCILVSTGHNSHERLSRTGHPVFPSLQDVTDILRR